MKRALSIVIAILVASIASAQTQGQLLVRSHGVLRSDDQVYGGRSIDWYDVQAPADGRLQMTVVSVDVSPVLVIRRGGSTEEIEGGRESARTTRSVTRGEYISIGVAALDGSASAWTGDPEYILQVQFSEGAAALAVGATIEGELDRGDEQSDAGQYIDWYPLFVDAGSRIRVSVTSGDFDTYLLVELADGDSLQDDDGGGGTDSSLAFTSQEAGTIRVGVRSYGFGDTGGYEVTVLEEVVRSVSIGQTYRGTIEGPAAVFEITGFPNQVVDVALSSPDFDPVLEISDSHGGSFYGDGYESSAGAQLVYVFGDSGSATVSVSSYGGTGEFDLSVTQSSVRYETPSDGYRLEGGESINGRISTQSPSLDGYYHQRFTFHADEGERVEITLESDTFDSFLRLVDPSGRESTDDDGAGDLNSRLTVTTTRAGIHEIYARPLSYDSTGLYTITFRRLDAARVLLSQRGQLTPNDDVDESGKAIDVISFRAESGQSITIDVMSSSFDTMARLQDQFGNIIQEDDDGGSGSDSRILFVPERSGTYQLVVTSFSTGSHGNYMVEISE